MKTVEITLDKVRKLAFPLMSLIRLKKEHGIELKDLQDKEKAQDIETILTIIWAGLIHEDKELSLEDLGYMIDITELPEISEKLTSIFNEMNAKNSQK
ncbi:hypothetical protein ABEU97_20345 [Priestia megaterium]